MTVETLGRAVDVYRRTASSRSAILLIAANLIPLVGVLLFGWSLWTILVLYWVENGIVGFWNVPKLLLAQGSILPKVVPPMPDDAALAATGWDPARAATLRAQWEQARQAQQRALDAAAAQRAASSAEPAANAGAGPTASRIRVFGQPLDGSGGRIGLAIFFLMHYGIFWFVHGVFIFALPMFFGGGSGLGGGLDGLGGGGVDCVPGDITIGPDGFPIPIDAASCGSAFGDINWTNVAIAAAALFISHGASFLLNYIGRGEYLTTSPMKLMGAPYGRVVILHLTILFGAFAVAALGAPIGALLVLVGLKTAFDLGLHLRERSRAAPPLPSPLA